MEKILSTIHNEIRKYNMKWGKYPERIYLGYDEIAELQRTVEANRYIVTEAGNHPNGRPFDRVMGLTIYYVYADSHLFVG